MKLSQKITVALVIAALLPLLIILILFNRAMGDLTQDAREQAREKLGREAALRLTGLARGMAARDDQFFQRTAKDVEMLARYAHSLYLQQPAPDPGFTGYFRNEAGQLLSRRTDPVAFFAPPGLILDAGVRAEIARMRSLDPIFMALDMGMSERTSVYFVSSQDWIRFYPHLGFGHPGREVDPSVHPVSQITHTMVGPEQNPDRSVVWSTVYEDPSGLGPMVTAAAPVYHPDGRFVGSIGIDVHIEDIVAQIESADLGPGAFAALVDGRGGLIALHPAGRPYWQVSASADLQSALTALAGGGGVPPALELAGTTVLAAAAPLPSTGWHLLVLQPEATALALAEEMAVQIERTRSITAWRWATVAILVSVLVLVVAGTEAGRLTTAMNALVGGVRRMAQGDLKTRIDLQRSDELGLIAADFNAMAERLDLAQAELMTTLSARNHTLEILTGLSHGTASSRHLGEFLAEVLDSALALAGTDCGSIVLDEPVTGVRELRRDGQGGKLPVKVDLWGHADRLGSMTLHVDAPLSPGALHVLAALGRQSGTVVENVRLYALAQQAAVLEERNRLARDLHDSINQSLFSMTLIGQAIPALMEKNPQRGHERIQRMTELARSALAEMRSLIFELRPAALAQEGLVSALQKHTEAVATRESLAIDFQARGERRLDLALEETLYRLAQEALNNVVKHAAADRAEVKVTFADDAVQLRVSDNGRGFAQAHDGELQAALDGGGFGLCSMLERVRLSGGSLYLTTGPGQGTCITADIPLTAGGNGP